MNKIPFFHAYDSISKTLTLRNAKYFPEEIYDFEQEIEILDVSQGSLKALPNRLSELTQLRIAFFSKNLFTELPEVLSDCPKLKVVGFKSCQISHISGNALPRNLHWLILTDNRLSKLPKSIGELTQLRKVALTGNRLEVLPEELSYCQNLELLRLSANCLKSEPTWLFDLPRLAWYADSGNLFQTEFPLLEQVPKFRYEQIKLNHKLGESPSSEVWDGLVEGFSQPLAIKKYKGMMTSDGYITDDLQSCILAGKHNNIIAVKGQIEASLGEKAGLVLERIPADYKSLGCPPSLESCTRDTFSENSKFNVEFILEILKNIASAMQHLHKRGLVHGDLYAHNILANISGHCYLGDFGAASRYDPTENKQREYIESRAFGYLIEDLILNCTDPIPNSLLQLQNACLSLEPKKRPLMRDILNLL